jgi:hypothetical protein
MNRPYSKIQISSLVLIPLILFGAGCAPILLVGAGAVAGYAVSRDAVTVDLDAPRGDVWRAAVEETKRLGGQIKKQDAGNGRLDAQIQKTDVVVTLEQLSPATVRVVIRARKNLMPQLELAQRLGVNIARQVS